MAEEKEEEQPEEKAKEQESQEEEKKEETQEQESESKEESKEQTEDTEKKGGPNLVYASLFLHSAGKEVNEDNLSSLVDAANVEVEKSQIKALVAALEDVDIEEAMEKSVAMPASGGAPAAPSSSEGESEDKEKEESEEDKEEKEEEAAEGLGALFG